MRKLSRQDNVRVISLIWTEQEQQPVCIVRITGAGVDQMLDDLWSSGHVIVNVTRFPFVPEN